LNTGINRSGDGFVTPSHQYAYDRPWSSRKPGRCQIIRPRPRSESRARARGLSGTLCHPTQGSIRFTTLSRSPCGLSRPHTAPASL